MRPSARVVALGLLSLTLIQLLVADLSQYAGENFTAPPAGRGCPGRPWPG